jgi:negative regulator of flagellin synthesis FlgM
MKIENNGISPLSSKQTDPTQRAERKQQTGGEVGSVNQGRDTAELSGNARLLGKARTSLDAVPDIRADKVAQLREQIQSGDYSIHVEEIARKIVGRVFPK